MIKRYLKKFRIFLIVNEFRHYLFLLLKTRLGLVKISNSTESSRESWKKSLEASSELKTSFGWGDQGQEINKKREIQYSYLRDLIVSKVTIDSVVIDLGCYDGFWTQFLGQAKKIICVDLFSEGFDLIKNRFDFSDKIEFYQTK